MAEKVLNVAQGSVIRRHFRAGLGGNQGGTSQPRREFAGLIGGGAFQPEQVPAGGAELPQAHEVQLQVAVQA
jgi:hypothetical protein